MYGEKGVPTFWSFTVNHMTLKPCNPKIPNPTTTVCVSGPPMSQSKDCSILWWGGGGGDTKGAEFSKVRDA